MSESVEETYYQKTEILKRAKRYCDTKNSKILWWKWEKRLWGQARDKCRNLYEEKKNREYGRMRYHNMPRKEKQKLKEYQKITVKSLNLINKTVFNYDLIVYAMFFSHAILNS